MRLISEEVRIDQAVAPADVSTAKTSSWFEMADYRRVLAFAQTATLTSGKHLTIQLLQAQNASGAGSKNLGSAVTVASNGGAVTASVEVEVSDLDLPNGFGFVAVQVSSDAGATIYGSSVLVRGDSRFGTGVA